MKRERYYYIWRVRGCRFRFVVRYWFVAWSSVEVSTSLMTSIASDDCVCRPWTGTGFSEKLRLNDGGFIHWTNEKSHLQICYLSLNFLSLGIIYENQKWTTHKKWFELFEVITIQDESPQTATIDLGKRMMKKNLKCLQIRYRNQ